MFLDAVRSRNAGLIRFAAELHHSGVIPPNTYVFDRGAVRRNAVRIAQTAREFSLQLYFMGKQIGYDEDLLRVIRESIPGAVAVDWMGAETMAQQGITVKHVGHLVPVPIHAMAHIMEQNHPEVWTLYDLEAAAALDRVARSFTRKQPVLLRIAGNDLFPGQEGGFKPEQVLAAAERIKKLPGLTLVGVTSYPCIAWDEQHGEYVPSSNLQAVLSAVEQLRAAGYPVEQINAPGNTSCSVLPLLARYGATHGEPGHALTGTTPEQASGKSVEEPAVVYVSEVSTVLSPERAQIYGGGLYPRAHAHAALVGSTVDELLTRPPIPVSFPPPQFIDYQCTLNTADGQQQVHTGDTVIMSFRFQLFVLRSYRAIVEQDEQGIWRLISLH
jgi:predicted amino acid racemase